MVIGKGVAREVRRKKEATFDTLPGATGAQLLRRTSFTLSPVKDSYQSDEIRTDYQISDMRHGAQSSEGTLDGEISPGTYDLEIASMLRQDFAAGATTGAVAVIASNVAGTFTRSAGSYLTDGFKVGDVVRFTGFVATANNNTNMLITALTATVMSVEVLAGTAIVTEAEGATVTGAVQGQKSFIPTSGHTDDSFTYEGLQTDLAVTDSETFTGVKIGSMDVSIPTTGMTTMSFGLMGKSLPVVATSEYFTTPTALTTTGILAGANGSIYVGGTKVATITSLDINLTNNATKPQAVGSNEVADIIQGRIVVTGTLTAYFEDGTLRDNFTAEDEISIYACFTTGSTATSDFICFTMPRVKFSTASKDDPEDSIVQTLEFQALYNGSGGSGINSEQTTISIQDSSL